MRFLRLALLLPGLLALPSAHADVAVPFRDFVTMRRAEGTVHEPTWAEISADPDRFRGLNLSFQLEVRGRIDAREEARLIAYNRQGELIEVVCRGGAQAGLPNEWIGVLAKVPDTGPVRAVEAFAITRIAPPVAAGSGASNAAASAELQVAGAGAPVAAVEPLVPAAPQPPAGPAPMPAKQYEQQPRQQVQQQPQPQLPPGYDEQTQRRVENFIASRNPRLAADMRRYIASEIIAWAYSYQMRWEFLASVIAVESNFNPGAVSPAGAMGLGQLMPGTAAGLGVGNAFDVRANLYGAARYLRSHLDRHAGKDGNAQFQLALASYNAGPGAVAKHGGVPPFAETINYIKKVASIYVKLCAQSGG